MDYVLRMDNADSLVDISFSCATLRTDPENARSLSFSLPLSLSFFLSSSLFLSLSLSLFLLPFILSLFRPASSAIQVYFHFEMEDR